MSESIFDFIKKFTKNTQELVREEIEHTRKYLPEDPESLLNAVKPQLGGDTYNIGQAGATGRYARSDNNTFIYSEQEKTLSEAAAEIHQLLKQLEHNNPTATEIEKIAYVNDETTPNFKRRVVAALQAGGEAAIEVFWDNPYINIGKAIVKGWIESGE